MRQLSEQDVFALQVLTAFNREHCYIHDVTPEMVKDFLAEYTGDQTNMPVVVDYLRDYILSNDLCEVTP